MNTRTPDAVTAQADHAPAPGRLTHAEAVRFLAQASWGAAPRDIDPIVTAGPAAWLAAQRTAPISLTRPYMSGIRAQLGNGKPKRRDKSAKREADLPFLRLGTFNTVHAGNFPTIWMRNIVFGEDALRQRVAWCWSQIMVVSFNNVARLRQNGEILADYYDTLAKHALGNFRDLLFAVSTHPAMAYFLSSLGNDKPDRAANQVPDENFAREVMQLFTIGLWDLNQDGTQKRDARGEQIAAYDNTDVEALARVFTGLWFAGKRWPKGDGRWPSPWLSDVPLAMFEDRHDRDEKVIFRDKPWRTTFAANSDGLKDFARAADMLTRHPNTAPFIATALIKFLVTSNPEPAYVKRVADVFVNNGAGVRGDLFAVVRAILLDDAARNPKRLSDPKHGKLQEPLLRLTRMVRALNAGRTSPELQFWVPRTATQLAQWPLYSPSVFNFFMPGYRHRGALAQNGLTGPEFQIVNSVTTAATANQFADFIDTLLHRRNVGDPPPFKFELGDLEALASMPERVVERLNILLCNGQLGDATRALIVDSARRLPERDASGRVRLALWLVAMSPAAAVLR
jgi:uncharacterized protein (DUF1800 family)